jgi:halimadienyl-diphosphate synthase
MDFQNELRQILTHRGPGHVMCTAYDTAWLARLGNIDHYLSDAALRWICDNQLEDGTWGAAAPFYYYDRVISTLAAMIALTWRGRRGQDWKQVERGRRALERIANGATQELMAHPNGATVGFEMIVPTLLAEAERLGLLQAHGNHILGRLKHMREKKMARLNGFRINRGLTIAYSLEMAGPDCLHLLDLERLQEENGSIAHSPSATAYYASLVSPGNEQALHYLRSVVADDGGAPLAAPFDVYERAWVLWNLALAGPLDPEILALCQPHLAGLESSWTARLGTGFGKGYSVQDGDDTSLVLSVFNDFGRPLDLAAVFSYEEDEYFRCYALEANPSVSANIHILDVLRKIECHRSDPAVQKIIRFLKTSRLENGGWLDKWHISPFYTTAHAVIALAEFEPDLARSGIEWILNARNPDGSWGFYLPTAEETAYAIQALSIWNRSGGRVPAEIIRSSAAWLEEHSRPPYPPLWIAKSLYYSEWVVRAEILSALMLAAQN